MHTILYRLTKQSMSLPTVLLKMPINLISITSSLTTSLRIYGDTAHKVLAQSARGGKLFANEVTANFSSKAKVTRSYPLHCFKIMLSFALHS